MPYRKTYEVSLEFVDTDGLLQRMQDGTNFILVDTVWTHNGNRHRIRGAATHQKLSGNFINQPVS